MMYIGLLLLAIMLPSHYRKVTLPLLISSLEDFEPLRISHHSATTSIIFAYGLLPFVQLLKLSPVPVSRTT